MEAEEKIMDREIGILLALGGLFLGLILSVVIAWRYEVHQRAVDKATSFAVSGQIGEIREVYEPSGWLKTLQSKYFMSIDGQEYEVTPDVMSAIDESGLKTGDAIKVTGKRGEIEGMEVIR